VKKKSIFKGSKIAPLCISIETVEVAFFVTGLEALQILGVEMLSCDPLEDKIVYIIQSRRSFCASPSC
jgi:hypothetical protein